MAVARRYEELEVWQIADALKLEVYALIATGPASQDFGFRNQIRHSAASTTKKIAEGFGRFQPAEFARFMEFAVASTMETKDSLKDGVDRGYFAPDWVAAAQQLAERSIKCSSRFIVYLKGCAKTTPRPSNVKPRTENQNEEPRTENLERRRSAFAVCRCADAIMKNQCQS